jgi:hypothetical protein
MKKIAGYVLKATALTAFALITLIEIFMILEMWSTRGHHGF